MRLTLTFLLVLCFAGTALAQAPNTPPPDERALGEIIVTGSHVEHMTKLAVLPSLAPNIEDVIVRSVVRHDFELSGMFEIISDNKAPPGNYQFDDPVDVDAWRKVGAEVIVKVAARKAKDNRVEVFGLAYFLDVGKEPVYERRFTVAPEELRITAHRVTDALLGAITGRPGGFASHFAFSTKWGRARRVFTMDSDGESLRPVTDADSTAIAPVWGPDGLLFFPESQRYSPYRLMVMAGAEIERVDVPFRTSVYSVSFAKDPKTMALAVAQDGRSRIYVGTVGSKDFKAVSSTEIATDVAYSPSGKLAWIGGGSEQGTQRVIVDGKAVSPAGFTAASPTFCDTEDGIRLVYAVVVGGGRQDLVMSDERGHGIVRLTQGQGSNWAPSCSPDGRLLAFFSTRKSSPGLMMMSLKRYTTIRVNSQLGESLNWARLPESTTLAEVADKKP